MKRYIKIYTHYRLFVFPTHIYIFTCWCLFKFFWLHSMEGDLFFLLLQFCLWIFVATNFNEEKSGTPCLFWFPTVFFFQLQILTATNFLINFLHQIIFICYVSNNFDYKANLARWYNIYTIEFESKQLSTHKKRNSHRFYIFKFVVCKDKQNALWRVFM